ncbi:MAG: cyanophycinase [Ferruginibacter sp.]
MKYKIDLLTALLLLLTTTAFTQKIASRGKLFIIGGGARTTGLMKTLMTTAQLKKEDYVVVLPMASEAGDTAYYYIKEDLRPVCSNTIANLNFTKETVNDKLWLDSVHKAKLIFITGGDQSRFMDIILHTPVHDAILGAFAKGATIAGSSAGAAMMSKEMITGNEYSGDSVKPGSFRKLQYDLVETKEGLGFLKTAVIDQHFIARSRYNRLLSVLAAFPGFDCIGIDESTAIIVNGKKITVTGEGQVVRLTLNTTGKMTAKKTGLIKLRKVQLNILTAGDEFLLK